MADKDELDLGGEIPSLPIEPSLPEGVAREPVLLPDEPIGVLRKEKGEAAESYKDYVFDTMKSAYEGETEDQIRSRVDEAIGNKPYLVGDEPGYGGALLTTKGAVGGGTIDSFRLHLQIAINNQLKPWYSRALSLIEAPDPKTLMTEAGAIEGGLLTVEGKSKSRLTPEEQADLALGQKQFVVGAGTFGGAVGALGGPAGALIGGIGGIGLGAAGAAIYGGYRELEEDLSASEIAYDLTRKLYNVTGIFDDFGDGLVGLSDEGREVAVSSIVALADAVGIDEAPELLDKHGIIDAESFSKTLRTGMKEYEEHIKRVEEIPAFGMGEAIPLARSVESAGYTFIGGVIDIAARVANDEKYRELRSKIRQKSLVKKQIARDLESRNQKPTEDDWAGLKIYERIEDEPDLESKKEAMVDGWLRSISYDELHPSLQTKPPSVESFIKIAKSIPADSPVMNADDNSGLITAIESVHLGKSKKDTQSVLNEVSMDAFTIPVFDDFDKGFIPSVDDVDGWAPKLLKKQYKIGRRTTKVVERAAFEMFTDRFESEEYGTLYKASTIAQILNWAGISPTALAEVDLPMSFTPAGIDSMLGQGIRDPNADWFSRVDARMKSQTGGFQVGYAENARAMGYNPDDWQYNLAQTAGFAMDMLNIEQWIFKAMGVSTRAAVNVPTALKEFRGADAGFKYESGKQALLSGVVESGSTDPAVQANQLIQEMMLRRQLNGDDAMGFLTEAERELFRRALLLTGRDPELYIAASAEAAGNTTKAKRAGEDIVRQIDTSDVVVFRNSIEYRSLANQVQNLVDEGIIEPAGKDVFLSMIENQAHKIAATPDTPFNNPIEVLRTIDLTIDRAPTGRARFRAGDKFEADRSVRRVRSIMDDNGMVEGPEFYEQATILLAGGKRAYKKMVKAGEPIRVVESLDELSDQELSQVFDGILHGGIKTEKAKPASLSKREINKIFKEFEEESPEGTMLPKSLTRKVDKKTVNVATKNRKTANTKPVAQKTTMQNAEASFEAIDAARANLGDVNPLVDDPSWNTFWSQITGRGDVMIPPSEIRRYINTQAMADEIKKVTPSQVDMANEGIKTVEAIGGIYKNGDADIELTGQLLLWTILSRSLSAFPHESAFIDAFLAGVNKFIRASADGTFDEKMSHDFTVWAGRGGKDTRPHIQKMSKAEQGRKAWKNAAKRRSLKWLQENGHITKEEAAIKLDEPPALRFEGSGGPAASNLNDFGLQFLRQGSEVLPDGHAYAGKTKLVAFHEALLDQSLSGKEVRRIYHTIFTRAGIDNKIISFLILAAGRDDIIVIDRVQANHFWGRNVEGGIQIPRSDGLFMDLYEGFSKPKKNEKWARDPHRFSTKRGLADSLAGARGVAIYEAIEELLFQNVGEAYRLAGRAENGSLARLHWETWVLNSGQEVGHETLKMILANARGLSEPAIGQSVREGKFAMKRYGIRYAVLPGEGRKFILANSAGDRFILDEKAFELYNQAITDDVNKKGRDDRVVPYTWSISDERFKDVPWFERPGVNREALDRLIERVGEPASPEAIVALERASQPVEPTALRGAGGDGLRGRGEGRDGGRDEGASPRLDSREGQQAVGATQGPAPVKFTKLTGPDIAERFEAAKAKNTRVENLAPKGPEDYKGAVVFMTADETAGFMVKDGDLQNVFNNGGPRVGGIGAGSWGIFKAIQEHGAVTLDCYSGDLVHIYTKFGFVEVARMDFNPDFAPKGWEKADSTMDRPDVVFMAYQGGDVSKIRDRHKSFDYKETTTRINDWDEAAELTRKSVKTEGDPQGVDTQAPTIRAQIDSGSGSPRGYYEYNSRTGESVINLFRNGDMDTLWHENGHMIASLMGAEWRQKLFGSFDHTVDADGLRVMSDLGHEQFADAWMHYRRVKDAPNGFVRRMFDELWVQLHNLWNRLRKRPGVLPKDVRAFWDLEFGELPSDRRFVTNMTARAVRKRPHTVVVSSSARKRILKSKPARISREMVAKEPSMNPEVLHQYFGDKLEVDVEVVTDVGGRETRIPRRIYGETTDDALEIVRKTIAYIKTQEIRKNVLKEPTVPIGTGRFIVPRSRAKTILDGAKRRLIDALGDMPDTIGGRIVQRDFKRSPDGSTSVSNRAELPDYVSDEDVADFANRILLRYGSPRRVAREKISTTEFIVLTDRESAGMRTLIQELAKEPIADRLPIDLLDPNANLRLIAVDEYYDLVRILQDVEAGPLNRINKNLADPGLIKTFSSVLMSRAGTKWLGDKVSKIGDMLTMEPARINVKNADPALVEILESYQRRMAAASNDIIKMIDEFDDPNAAFVDFYRHTVKFAVPVVPLGKVRTLFDIVKELDGMTRRMDADAAAAVRRADLEGGDAPMGLDPVTAQGGDLSLQFIFDKLSDIQDLLDDYRGMTRLERQAIIKLRELSAKSEFSEVDRIMAADAIHVLDIALKEKHQFVYETTLEVFKIALGVEGEKINWGFDKYDPEIMDLYKAYYTGDLLKLYDVASSKSLIPLEIDAAKRIFGKVQSQDVDNIALLTNVLVYTKMADIRYGLARELAEAGYNLSRRDIMATRELGEIGTMDRERYIDRVAYYINQELEFQDKLVVARGEGVKAKPGKPGPELYGQLENPYIDGTDTKVISQLDKEAKGEASRIIDQMGLRRELGQFNVVRIGDKTLLLPENAIQGIEEAFGEVYKNPVRFKRNFGDKGTIEYELVGDVTPKQIQVLRDAADAFKRIYELSPLNPKVFYTGLLVGSGGIPMVPYMMGVFIGTLSQVHLGQGSRAAIADGIAFAPTMAMATIGDAAGRKVDFVAGVLARTFGDGNHRPLTKPHITPDGRVFTADFIANGIDRYGLKQSFANFLKNRSVHDRVFERFSQANPWVGGSVIGGVLGTALAGPLGGAAGAAVGGVTLGTLFKRGNFFTKAHRFYAEVSTAIDTYFRIKVLVRELDAGATMEQAARKVRDVVLDYSDLSELEKSYFKSFFAFYVYFKQASKLFAKSIVENPDRVIGQLKLARSTQLAVTDLEGTDQKLAPWDRTRMFLPWKFGDHAIRAPYLISADIVSLFADIINAIPLLGGEEETLTAQRGLVNRMNPLFLQAFKQVYKIDPGRGYALDRATNQIPALLVQLDHDLTGGALHDYFGIRHIPQDEIKFTYDEKTGRRVNLRNLEMPGRGIYVSTKPLRASLFMDYLQYPFTGRMLDVIEALDRSNLGITEAMVSAANAYYELDKERPLLARVPGFVEMGLVKAKREPLIGLEKMTRPTDIDRILDTSTARRPMREDFSFVGTEGDNYLLRYGDFHPLELLRLIGFSAVPVRSRENQGRRKVKQHISELESVTDK